MRKNTLLTSLAVALIAFAGSASAGENSGTLTVQATITPECVLVDGNLNFGTLGGILTAPALAFTEIKIECNDAGIPFNVFLGIGTAGDATSRRMQSSGKYLPYQVYSDLNRTTLWGDGSMFTYGGGVSATSVGGVGTQDTLYAYGRIPAGTRAASASYSDLITMRVTF